MRRRDGGVDIIGSRIRYYADNASISRIHVRNESIFNWRAEISIDIVVYFQC